MVDSSSSADSPTFLALAYQGGELNQGNLQLSIQTWQSDTVTTALSPVPGVSTSMIYGSPDSEASSPTARPFKSFATANLSRGSHQDDSTSQSHLTGIDEADIAPSVHSHIPLTPSDHASAHILRSLPSPDLTMLMTGGPNPFASSLSRDALLSYAYFLYDSPTHSPPGLTPVPIFSPLPNVSTSEEVYKLRLLPLLVTLRSLHPGYIPVLLLLSCTYHALGDYESCIKAEAMCNIGTTMRVLGHNDQAYEWWWKALLARPLYWDALDNLHGLLFSLAQDAQCEDQRSTLHSRALDICRFVQRQVVDGRGGLRLSVDSQEFHRLQKVFFTAATIRNMGPSSLQDVVTDYFRVIELVIRPQPPSPAEKQYNMKEFILSAYVAGFVIATDTEHPLPSELLQSLGVPSDRPIEEHLNDPNFDLFQVVRAAGDKLVSVLLRIGGGALPLLLLYPGEVMRLLVLLFPSSRGVLPAICTRSGQDGMLLPSEETRKQTNLITSYVLLMLAKLYQDLSSSTAVVPGFNGTVNVNHSLAILFYYIALALSPSPSTYNDMGIILSTIVSTRTYRHHQSQREVINGPTLAKVYYETGLGMDSSHPHLLTNLGSLYKDQGKIDEAIQLYKKAIEVRPDFDVALANMGNAIRDTGRSWEAVDWYRRAVDVNPALSEAICGLVNSLCSVCDWRGRGGLLFEVGVDEYGNFLQRGTPDSPPWPGYMTKMVETCYHQLQLAYGHNIGIVAATASLEDWLKVVKSCYGRNLRSHERSWWDTLFGRVFSDSHPLREHTNEAGFVIRFVNWARPRLQRQWYVKVYGKLQSTDRVAEHDHRHDYAHWFPRPEMPKTMTPPLLPSVLPFNTFTYPLSPRTIRLISHRHALRISYTALTQPWLPTSIYPPPRPPLKGKLRIGYVSNDVNNHPLAHLMQSVFGLHDRSRFMVSLYTTSPWDGTAYRPKIAKEVERFVDASQWSTETIVNDILRHGIHVLINLGGYTKGARNDVFAVRPCPVQIQLMGFAGTLGAGWCDYLVTDRNACPTETSASERWRYLTDQRSEGRKYTGENAESLDLYADLDPEDPSEKWVFTEKFIYMPHTLMVTDHKQSYRADENVTTADRARIPESVLWSDEEVRRSKMRHFTFPDLPPDFVIFANFNQLYKIDPEVFAAWLRILMRVPRSILWILRFPAAGEEHLLRTAKLWAGEEVASRIRFTDVAKKEEHIHRSRVADLFLDTFECNAHTIAADVLWSGTPILTWPKYLYKMCSRVAASMVHATGFGDQMIVNSLAEYEDRAVSLANNLRYSPTLPGSRVPIRAQGELISLRRNLFLNRDKMPLFDTERWTRNIEKAYNEAWRRWVDGTQYERSDEWEECQGPEKESGCIWVTDNDPVQVIRHE